MNDAALLERWVQRQDAEAFNEIVSRFADQVFATCRNILRNDADAEEVAQECFLLLVRSGDDVRASLGGWLHRVATTKSLDRIRSEARRRKYEQAHAGDAPHHTEATWDDIQEHVDAAIETLPEELREAVVAHFIGRRSHLEIALELHLTRRAVSYRIQRGVEALRAELVRRGVTVSCAGLGAILLAEAAPAAPLSLKASLGKLALAAGLPPSSGASAAAAVKTAGSLILMKTKLIVVAVIICVAGVYIATRPDSPQPPDENVAALESEDVRNETTRTDKTSPDAATAEATLASVPATGPAGEQTASEEHPGVITGVVLLPTGLPAQGATVRYTWEPSPREAPVEGLSAHESKTVNADAEGLFAFDRVPRGRVCVVAEHSAGLCAEQLSVGAYQQIHDITLILQGGKVLSGVVVSRDGSPIAGARVTPFSVDENDLPEYESAARAVTSAGDGSFSLAHLLPGDWTLQTRAEGYGTELSPPTSADSGEARIVLSPGIDLECQVIHEDTGKPVAGVTVTLKYPERRTNILSVTSGKNGIAVLAGLGKGSYFIDVENKLVALDGPPLPAVIDPARIPGQLKITVVDSAQVRGRIFDETTNTGIPGVVFGARSSSGGRVAYSMPSEEDGSYLITGLPTGDYNVGPMKLPAAYPAYRGPSGYQSVSLTEGCVVDEVNFSISPSTGPGLAGVVVDTAGQPVAGASLLAREEGSGVGFMNWFSDENGRFQIADYEEGTEHRLRATTRTAKSDELGPFTVGAPGSDAIEIVLSLTCNGIIAGTLTDPQGRPIAGNVSASLVSDSENPLLLIPGGDADGFGNFVLSEVCAGTYKLSCSSGQQDSQDGPTIQIGEGERMDGVQLVYDAGLRYEIAGVVVDEEQNPVAGAKVNAKGQSPALIPSVTSDENGAFHFKDLAPGRYMLEATAEGYGKQSMGMAESGDMDAVVQIMSAATISGRATDTQGRPVVNFLMSLMAEGGTDFLHANQHFSDENGAFSIEVPFNSNWILRVEAEGYATAEVNVGMVGPGHDLANTEIVLEAAR